MLSCVHYCEDLARILRKHNPGLHCACLHLPEKETRKGLTAFSVPSRSDAADSARSLASANLSKSTAQLQADSFTSTEKSAQSESAASDTTDALPLSSAAKAGVLSSMLTGNSSNLQNAFPMSPFLCPMHA